MPAAAAMRRTFSARADAATPKGIILAIPAPEARHPAPGLGQTTIGRTVADSPGTSMNVPGYRIQGEIGHGAMATVYLAVQERLDREVALKVMSPNLDSDATFRKRFLKEGRIIAHLSHPNIVTVHDIGAFDNYHYMALEYAGAGNLTQRIQQGLSVEQTLAIVRKIASALGYAHARGFIHRDVKPENILFRDSETPVLSDFGIAKAMDSSTQMTNVGLAVGTPRYMSPEQAMGKEVGAQSDLYSLGVVLYEMLTGHRPYDAQTSFAIALMHINEPVPKLPEPYIRFQPLIDRCMAKRATDRFADAAQLIRTLDELQGVEPTGPQAIVEAAAGTLSYQQLAAALSPTGGDTTGGRHSAPGITPVSAAGPTLSIPLTTPTRRWLPPVGAVALLAAMLVGLFLADLPPFGDGGLDQPQSVRPTQEFVALRLERLQDVLTAYQRVLRLTPDNPEARQGLAELVRQYHDLARWAWANGDQASALKVLEQGLAAAPDDSALTTLRQRILQDRTDTTLNLAQRRQVERWLIEAEGQLAADKFVLPVDDNAVATYRQVLELDPTNEIAQRRLNDMAAFFETQARADLADGQPQRALVKVRQGLLIAPGHPGLLRLQEQIRQ